MTTLSECTVDAHALRRAARALFSTESYAQCASVCAVLRQLEPQDPMAMLYDCASQLRLGNTDVAEATFDTLEKQLQADPNSKSDPEIDKWIHTIKQELDGQTPFPELLSPFPRSDS